MPFAVPPTEITIVVPATSALTCTSGVHANVPSGVSVSAAEPSGVKAMPAPSSSAFTSE